MPPTPWEVARTMIRTASFLAFSVFTLAACGPIQPNANPLVWEQTYPRHWEALTSCLAQRTPTEYSVAPAFDKRLGVGGVLLSSRQTGKKAGEFDIYRIDDTNSRVVFRSDVLTVGGSSYIIDQAQQVANSCAN
jgi:hypothetical protein